jgi:hypothetical protein
MFLSGKGKEGENWPELEQIGMNNVAEIVSKVYWEVRNNKDQKYVDFLWQEIYADFPNFLDAIDALRELSVTAPKLISERQINTSVLASLHFPVLDGVARIFLIDQLVTEELKDKPMPKTVSVKGANPALISTKTWADLLEAKFIDLDKANEIIKRINPTLDRFHSGVRELKADECFRTFIESHLPQERNIPEPKP